MADNDVLIKCAAYRLLDRLDTFGLGEVGVLGVARFVVESAIAKHDRLRDRESARAAWLSFRSRAQELEPSPDEVQLATRLEQTANELGLALDVGESQLCAMAVRRLGTVVLSGDKRSISAAEILRSVLEVLADLDGRVVCLEQALDAVCADLGYQEVRTRVCAEPYMDKALSICFACSSAEVSGNPSLGLASYIADVRASAPNLLAESLLSS